MLLLFGNAVHAQEPSPRDPRIQPWLTAQDWERDTDGPALRLGAPGNFDDAHLLAPCVARIDGMHHLWYNGARGEVKDRIFELGLATSLYGKRFERHSTDSVFRFGDGKKSVLTTTILRTSAGAPIRENGVMRMWFSAADLAQPDALHTLHETSSTDGVHWTIPSKSLLSHVYAPTILKDSDKYRMWYTDVSKSPWVLRMAESVDGKQWEPTSAPVLEPKASWEQSRLFYPYVLKINDVYLMWYGSYWSKRKNTTAIGFAVSLNGQDWLRHPSNPVLRPDPNRAWESNYVTSHTVLRDERGAFRIWYASRKKPPFVNKYFAMGTAQWAGPRRAK